MWKGMFPMLNTGQFELNVKMQEAGKYNNNFLFWLSHPNTSMVYPSVVLKNSLKIFEKNGHIFQVNSVPVGQGKTIKNNSVMLGFNVTCFPKTPDLLRIYARNIHYASAEASKFPIAFQAFGAFMNFDLMEKLRMRLDLALAHQN